MKKINKIIRTEAIALFLVFCTAIGLYTYFFLDNHIRWILKNQLTRLHGAQVDVEDVTTSFINPGISISGLQVTNSERPSYNIFELGRFAVSVNWSGLLRSKIHVEDIQLNDIGFETKRSEPGRVLSNEGTGTLSALTNLATTQVKKQTKQGNLGNLLEMIEDPSARKALNQYKDQLNSMNKIQGLRNSLDKFKANWNTKIENLPDDQKLNNFRQRIENLKSSRDDPAKLLANLRKAKDLIEELKSIRDSARNLRDSFESDYSSLNTDFKSIDSAIQKDRETLSNQFQLPTYDMGGLSNDLFEGFLNRQAGSLAGTLKTVRAYIPESTEKETDTNKPAEPVRATGTDYTFRTARTYPFFWIKSSTVNANLQDKNGGGEIRLDLRSLSSTPSMLDDPARISMKAELPGARVTSWNADLTIDRRSEISTDQFRVNLKGWKLKDWALLNDSDYNLAISEAAGEFSMEGTLKGSTLKADLNASLSNPSFAYDADASWLKSVLKSTVDSLKSLQLQATTEGPLDNLTWSVTSNLGSHLKNALESQISDRIKTAKRKLLSDFDSQVSSRKKELASRLDDVKSRVTQRIEEVKSNADNILNKARDRSNTINKELDKKKDELEKKKEELKKSLEEKLKF